MEDQMEWAEEPVVVVVQVVLLLQHAKRCPNTALDKQDGVARTPPSWVVHDLAGMSVPVVETAAEAVDCGSRSLWLVDRSAWENTFGDSQLT